jgi:hypothetical protein
MKLIIAGSRNYEDYQQFKVYVDYFTQNIFPNIEIVSGNARGPDKMAIRYAVEHNLNYRIFNADWEGHGKAAGPIRNEQMANYADALLAFWDGKSRGTKHMIDIARLAELKVRVVEIKPLDVREISITKRGDNEELETPR